MSAPNAPSWAELEPHRARLWGLCFRITGVAADADELVQETFARALEAPPRDRSRELEPWLVRVATNASRDVLRRRKRQTYVGPWLPSPVDAEALASAEQSIPEARYGLAESLSYAFLLALEALSPTQRAILVLRDVLDCSVRETAVLLGESEANVKTAHHRARKALELYDEQRASEGAGRLELAQRALGRLLLQVGSADVESIARELASDAVLVTDGGGEFLAALNPVVSREHVARLLIGTQRGVVDPAFRPTTLSGLPGVLGTARAARPRAATRSVTLFECDARGEIVHIYGIVASRKIAHLTF